MKKLIELLNEYESKRHKTSVIANIRKGEDRLSYLEMNWNYSELLCISKGYEFIQRLVENDKIDKYKVIELEHNWIRPFKLDNLYWEIKLEERLLMLLSIQDEPISFLISILK